MLPAVVILAAVAAYMVAWWRRQSRVELRLRDVEEFLYGECGSPDRPHATGMLVRVMALEEGEVRSRVAAP